MKTKQTKPILLALLLIQLALGCAVTTAPSFRQVTSEPDANFHPHVSNQSFAESTLDIIVTIDGKTAVADYLKVMNRHHWELYSIRLSKGKHVLHAEAREGAVLLDTSFEVSKEHWAILSYWGRGGKKNGKLDGLKFDVLDKPPLFV
jgi:hypothetical protein